MNWRTLPPFHPWKTACLRALAARCRRRPAVELLEERNVLSTASSITASFNGSAIPAGDTLWFSSAFQASGLPKTGSVELHVVNASVSFTANGTAYNVAAPDSDIVLTNGATSATTS
jgi:hypothetical protein